MTEYFEYVGPEFFNIDFSIIFCESDVRYIFWPVVVFSKNFEHKSRDRRVPRACRGFLFEKGSSLGHEMLGGSFCSCPSGKKIDIVKFLENS